MWNYYGNNYIHGLPYLVHLTYGEYSMRILFGNNEAEVRPVTETYLLDSIARAIHFPIVFCCSEAESEDIKSGDADCPVSPLDVVFNRMDYGT